MMRGAPVPVRRSALAEGDHTDDAHFDLRQRHGRVTRLLHEKARPEAALRPAPLSRDFDLEEHAPYDAGNRFEHIAMDVEGDFHAAVERLRAQGVKVLQGPKRDPSGTRWIAFVEDPNGIPVELLEPRAQP
jgi:catechol 2,3-dioxygenase-like lactoylglutathione lyase family enzyme